MILPDNILTPVGNLRGFLTSGGLIPGVPVIIGTASGNPAHFEDGTDNFLIELIIEIELYQEGSGDPSINNPRPLHGRTEAEIHVADGETPHIIDNVVSVSWQDEVGTIYNGDLNLTSGVLTAKYIKQTLNGTQTLSPSQVNWRPQTNSVGWYYNIPDWGVKISSDINVPSNAVSDKLKNVSYNNVYVNDICSMGFLEGGYAKRLFVRITDTSLTTVTAINTYLTNNPIDIVYELETPITYQLTPTQIRSLHGTNNIWVDTGDILDCKYIADINIFLQWVYDNLYNP